jgi:hypothetical protein
MIRTKMQSFKMTRKLILSGLFITGLLGNTAVLASNCNFTSAPAFPAGVRINVP